MATMNKSLLAAMLSVAALAASNAGAGTLDEIKANGAIRIAYREDAPPFSYSKDKASIPMGFMLDLCRSAAAH